MERRNQMTAMTTHLQTSHRMATKLRTPGRRAVGEAAAVLLALLMTLVSLPGLARTGDGSAPQTPGPLPAPAPAAVVDSTR
jgi:hypothetical protein